MKTCKRGKMSKAQSKDFPLNVVKWHNNSVVTVLWNCDSVSDNDTVQRWDRSAKAFVNIERTASIQHYNNNMGGVDYLDRVVAEYRMRIRYKKWWYPYLTNTLSVLMFFSWKLLKTANPDWPRFLGYLRCVTCHYLDENISQAVKWAMGESFHANPKRKLRGEYILQLDSMELTTGQRECLVTLGLDVR